MTTRRAMPYPLKKMLEHLDLNIARGFRTAPALMEGAVVACRMCEMFDNCDYDVESRYFLCPNRDRFDQLERLQGKI
ncbi:MAG: hypothetical protein ACTSWI_04385 [Alphaproteobacteria bacterium]